MPPKSLIPAPDQVNVLEERLDILPPTHASLVRVSERQLLSPGVFNAVPDAVTRQVTIAGISLHWNGTNPVLESFNVTRDVAKVIVIADEVRIEQAVRWKGADVEIYARRLVFRNNGELSTEPEPFATKAFSTDRDDAGRPLGPNGAPKAKNGRPGQRGGSIALHVHELDSGDPSAVRFVTTGSPGEVGEDGGLLDFPQFDHGPNTKDVKALTIDDLYAAVKDVNNSHDDLGELKVWKTDKGDGETGFKACWAEVPAGFTVTDIRLSLQYQQFLARYQTRIRVPDHDDKNVKSLERIDVTAREKEGNVEAFDELRRFQATMAPANGEDAFPSGTTGAGGDAGRVSVTPQIRAGVEQLIRAEGGASVASAEIAGGAAGSPSKYALIAMTCIQDTIDTKVVSPLFGVETGTRHDGAGAGGSARGEGNRQPTPAPLDGHSWLDPRLLWAVVAYARQVFAGGDRERAWRLVRPYWEALRISEGEAAPIEMRASGNAICSLVQNYQQNLDLYGNPPGWAPRFSAESYLRTYLADRRFSARFVSTMDKAVKLMESVAQAEAMLGMVAQQAEGAIEQLRRELFASYRRYSQAQDTLHKAEDLLKAAQRELDGLKARARDIGLIEVSDQALVSAVFEISASVLDAIPVYQPALSAVGTIVRGVGKFTTEALYGDEPTNGWTALEIIGGSVADALDENADAFKDLFDSHLQEKFKDKLNPEADDMRTEVARLQTALGERQEAHDAQVEDAMDRLTGDDELAALLRSDQDSALKLADVSYEREQLGRQIKETNLLITDLDGLEGQEGFKGELAARRKQNLLAARQKIYILLGQAQNHEFALKNEREHNKEEIEAAETRREKLTSQAAKLDELLPDLEKLETQESIDAQNKTFGKIVDGATRLARGASKIGASIAGVVRGPEADSEEVQRFTAKILAGPLKEDYRRVQQNVERARAQMSQALTELTQSNHSVATLTADFTGAIQSSIDISRNRQAFALGVDAGLKNSFLAMQRQAQERMDLYLYLFRQAYMYEFCETAGQEVADLNALTSQIDGCLQKISQAKTNLPNNAREDETSLLLMAQLAQVSDDDLRSAADEALHNTLSGVANRILMNRGSSGAKFKNSFRLVLPEDKRATLLREGRVTLEETAQLLPELYENSERETNLFFRNPKMKVSGITIPAGDFELRRKPGSSDPIRIVLAFGHEMALWDGERFVSFRLGNSERPLEYGFNANTFDAIKERGLYSARFTADDRTPVDELFATIMGETSGTTINYAEISPSVLSSMTIMITIGRGQIEAIEKLALMVTLQAN